MKRKGNLTKQRITKESLLLFTDKGYYATTIRDILAATNLSKGGVYAYFSNKEDLWHATYEEAKLRWKNVVFKDVRDISDPIDRLNKVIQNILRNYLSRNIFKGGAYFVPMLVELSGRSTKMRKKLVDGFQGFGNLIHRWLKEAEQKDLLRNDLRTEDVAYFILTALSGATILYITTKNIEYLKRTLCELNSFVDNLRA